MEPLTFLLVFLIGLISSFIGALVGGAGLISIPLLIFTGLPPQVAIATNKLGTLGASTSAIYRFSKSKKIIYKYVIPFSLISIVGSYIGANILLEINQQILSAIVGIIILLFLPLILMKRDLGIKRIKISIEKRRMGYFLYFLSMIYGGSVGAGYGILSAYILIWLFGLTVIESNATGTVPWFLVSLISLIIFAINGIVNYSYGIILLFSMLLGGYLGAHTAIKGGDRRIKLIFVILVIASAIKLLFF